MSNSAYPQVRADTGIEDDYHGKKIADPYRWLEDPNAEETKAFVTAQNNLTMPFINSSPVKPQLTEKLTAMWDYPKYDCFFKRGNWYYYFHNTGLQNQNVLYRKANLENHNDLGEIFFDPNLLSSDGTVALQGYTFSEDSKIFAYGLSARGSDWTTIHFRDVATGKDFPDILHRVKFSSMSWTHDNKGIFYNRYLLEDGEDAAMADGTETAQNLNQKLCYHLLGTNQASDRLCYETPDHPTWHIGACVSDCGRYVFLDINEGCEPHNLLYVHDLDPLSKGVNSLTSGEVGLLPVVKLVDTFEAVYDVVTNDDTLLTIRTNLNAPLYKLITIDLSNPEKALWRDLIPEHKDDLLQWSVCANEKYLIVCYMHDVKNILQLHDLKTGAFLKLLPLEVGSIVSIRGKKNQQEFFYQFKSFLVPSNIYRCSLADGIGEPQLVLSTQVGKLDVKDFVVQQKFFTTNDGITKVPMFILHHKEVVLNGDNPCLLYGYGGFNIPITPNFSLTCLTWLRYFRGVYAVANIRGGGEYGEKWHNNGRLANKQNCFDDFQGAAKFLITENYTNSKKLIIEGGSNGGLLVAACLNQRPDLFKVGIAHVGVLDMLRFHKFTIGHAWTSDYGNPDIQKEFETLIKYSPLHNIPNPKGPNDNFPCVLLLTADHDDRVVPLHSMKYIAKLQETWRDIQPADAPLMIRVDVDAGHGFGKPTAKKILEIVDVYCFIQRCINLQFYD